MNLKHIYNLIDISNDQYTPEFEHNNNSTQHNPNQGFPRYPENPVQETNVCGDYTIRKTVNMYVMIIIIQKYNSPLSIAISGVVGIHAGSETEWETQIFWFDYNKHFWRNKNEQILFWLIRPISWSYSRILWTAFKICKFDEKKGTHATYRKKNGKNILQLW